MLTWIPPGVYSSSLGIVTVVESMPLERSLALHCGTRRLETKESPLRFLPLSLRTHSLLLVVVQLGSQQQCQYPLFSLLNLLIVYTGLQPSQGRP
jgi:hypothetical protein